MNSLPNTPSTELPKKLDPTTSTATQKELSSIPTPSTVQDPLEPKPNTEKNPIRKRKRKPSKKKPISSSEESIEYSIQELLGDQRYRDLVEKEVRFEQAGWELGGDGMLEVRVHSIGSFGDGLSISPNQNWILVIPFTVPNDLVKIKVYRHDTLHSFADLISINEFGAWRDNSLIKCQYFGKCSGCQYQMISYEKQLELKQIVVEKAFKHFSGLDPSLLPKIEPTLPSPLQYAYRTKLTPHFELPRNIKAPQSKLETKLETKEEEGNENGIGIGNGNGKNELRIGFAEKGRKRVLDIEDCMIATSVINEKLTQERIRVRSTIHTFKRGATLLLRDSLIPITQTGKTETKESLELATTEPDRHICVTNHKEIVREKVLSVHFEQNAGSFFQNNSSILNPFLSYIKSLLDDHKPSRKKEEGVEGEGEERYLVDAYCGSGLFSIGLADQFTKSMGIEVSSESIYWAKHNAKLNKIENVEFMVGKAEAIFADLNFPAQMTTVIIDPPRKGCDEVFLDQLLDFKPKRILYVSCNVHTQARDVGKLGKVYRVQSIRGADFFPQSHHCESIVSLSLIE